MSQSQDNYLLKIKNISGILALIIGVSTFGINYYVALKTYNVAAELGIAPETPIWATRLLYEGCFIALSLTFSGLAIGSKNRIKNLIYYTGANFYLFLAMSYILNQLFDILIEQNKIIFTLILTCMSCIIYYHIRLRKY